MIRLAHPRFDRVEVDMLARVLEGGALVQGEQVAAFEQALARTIGCESVVVVSSGTAALHLALAALDLGPGDEVVTAAFTFPATTNVIELVGATPVLVDIDIETFTCPPGRLVASVTDRTRAVMPVHEFGLMVSTTALRSALDERIAIVEDAACALGASDRETPAGRGGDFGCFSFHPRKSITTGEGGAISTNSAAAAARLRQLRNHGISTAGGEISFVEPGFNYRLTEFQAVLGLGQLARLDEMLSSRRRVAAWYDDALGGVPWLSRPSQPGGFEHAYQSYVVMLDESINRTDLIGFLRTEGVESVRGAYAVHRLDYYARKYGFAPSDFPNANAAHERSLALPLHPGVCADDVATVAAALRRFHS